MTILRLKEDARTIIVRWLKKDCHRCGTNIYLNYMENSMCLGGELQTYYRETCEIYKKLVCTCDWYGLFWGCANDRRKNTHTHTLMQALAYSTDTHAQNRRRTADSVGRQYDYWVCSTARKTLLHFCFWYNHIPIGGLILFNLHDFLPDKLSCKRRYLIILCQR